MQSILIKFVPGAPENESEGLENLNPSLRFIGLASFTALRYLFHYYYFAPETERLCFTISFLHSVAH